MELVWAQHALRLACVALLAGMTLSGVLLEGSGVDLLERLPEFSICFARWLSELPCPGCGMLRGLLCLGQLRFAAANALHPLVLPTSFAIAWVAAGKPGRSWLQAMPEAASRTAVALATCIVLGLWVLRVASGSGI